MERNLWFSIYSIGGKLEDNLLTLESQLRESFGRVVYSHKAHEKMSDILHSRLNVIKLSQIILSAITTGGLFVTLFGDSIISTVIAAITSTLLLILTSYNKEINLGELIQKHSDVACELWNVREHYFSLLTDIKTKILGLKDASQKRDELQELLKSIYQNAPRTSAKAYKLSQQALKINEELTFSDEEIDMFLPKELRKQK